MRKLKYKNIIINIDNVKVIHLKKGQKVYQMDTEFGISFDEKVLAFETEAEQKSVFSHIYNTDKDINVDEMLESDEKKSLKKK
jgi:hypothetical protein